MPGPQGPQGEKGDPGEGIKDASELLAFMEGTTALDVALNQDESKVKFDLSSAEKAIIDNKLALPTNAPASQILVGVNTSKEQNAIGIGAGLELSSGQLQVNVGSGVEINQDNEITVDTSTFLTLPESAPAAQKLVGVNTSNVENYIDIGSQLLLENGVLNGNYLVLD